MSSRLHFVTSIHGALALLGLALAANSALAQISVTVTTSYASGTVASVTAVDTITTSGTVTVASGANVEFKAGNKVVKLEPGFKAAAGSIFHAWLPATADADHDGIPNWWEVENGLDANSANATADADGDGLTNIAEYNLGTNPQVKDSIPSQYASLSYGDFSRTEAVGATAGQFDVDASGAATYTLPIWVTPGTAGLQPKLGLSYNSRAGNDIAGYGWSLTGPLKISRLPATLAQDGFVNGINYDSTDRFALDGQRLMVINGGTYGATNAEYRTEIDSFSRIVSFGVSGAGPTRFRVWTKDGLIMDFGNPSDGSRSDCTVEAADGQNIRAWYVRRIADINGNYMEFTYSKSTSAGTHLLTKISYTGNTGTGLSPYASVQFAYEDRSDVFRGYVQGAVSAVTQRLSAIKVYYGSTLVRSYALDYVTRSYTNRSILATVTETGLNGTRYPALSFDYTNPGNGWDTSTTVTNKWTPPIRTGTSNASAFYYQQNSATIWADIDGDGRSDLIYSYDVDASTHARATWLARSSGWLEASGGSGQLDYRITPALDSGALYYTMNAPYQYPSTDSYSIAGPYPAFNAQDFQVAIYDSDGDGNPDVVGPGWDCDSWLPLIHATTQDRYANYIQSGLNGDGKPRVISTSEHNVTFLDLNADGLPDILKSTVAYLSSMASDGSMSSGTASAWTLPVDPRYGCQFADLNGDGLPDIVCKADRGSLGVTDAAYLNTGTGWVSATQFKSAVTLYLERADLSYAGHVYGQHKGTGTMMADVNNDGIPDLVHAQDVSSGGTITQERSVYFGTGTGWVDASASGFSLPFALVRCTTSAYVTGAQFTDINGDGALDYVWYYIDGLSSPVYKGVAINKRVNPDRLSAVTTGLGAKINVTYAPLTERASDDSFTVYDRTTGATYPVRDVPVPSMQVVKKVAYDSGVLNSNGTHQQYTISYRYGGLRDHALRGSLGFETVRITDDRTDLQTTTTYSQAFPKIGKPLIVSVTAPGTTAGTRVEVSHTENTWAVKSLNSSVTSFPYLQQVDTRKVDLDGSFISASTTAQSAVDSWGNVGTIEQTSLDATGTPDGYGTTTTNVFYPATKDTASETATRWFVDQLKTTTVTASAPPGSEARLTGLTCNSSFTYYTTTGLLHESTVEPTTGADSTHLALKTTYDYDDFGNQTSVTLSGGGMADRTSSMTFDTKGRVRTSVTNALNQTETYYYGSDPGVLLGVPARVTDANQLVTSWTYDDFGHKLTETRPSSSSSNPDTTTYRYRWCDSSAPAGALYEIETVSPTGARSLALYDMLGRAIYSFGINGGPLNGSPLAVGVRTTYDENGRVSAVSLPFSCTSGVPSSPTAASSTTYDVLGRPKTIVTADDPASGTTPVLRTTTTVYAGRTTKVTNPKSQVTRSVKNSLGLVGEIYNNDTGSGVERGRVVFTYDAFGQLCATETLREDDTKVRVEVYYDARGRKTKMIDPDAGTINYGYNAAGKLTSQSDASSNATSFEYDDLGRLKKRTEPEGVTIWTYDTATRGSSATWAGLLASVSVSPTLSNHKAYTETYAYDGLGRVSKLTRTIDGIDYSQWQDYDDYSRPTVTTYPGATSGSAGYKVKNVYDSLGFLHEVRDGRAAGAQSTNDVPTNFLYWKADGYSLTGALNASTLGNGVVVDHIISDITGRIKAIASGPVRTDYSVQNISYLYDQLGNVTRRQDAATGRDESFVYDGLNRLKTATLNGGAADPGQPVTLSMTYDALGDIKSKSNAATSYLYDPATRPHAVKSVSGGALGARDYAYDARGNLLTEKIGSAVQRSQAWTSYNQVKTISKSGRTTEFWFGAAHERVLQQDGGGSTTVYVGSAMEVVTTGSLVEREYYIFTPAGRVAVRTERSDATAVETRFFHDDALGSLTAVTTETGSVEQRFLFDAWGLRYQSADTRPSNHGGDVTRGYTDHEQLDDFGLIHMNGRVYDPTLSRFLSTDAFIQNPFDNQTFNKYSYVFNNPLNHTDPSGWYAFTTDSSGTPIALVTQSEMDEMAKNPEFAAEVKKGLADFAKNGPTAENTNTDKTRQTGFRRESLMDFTKRAVAGREDVFTLQRALIPASMLGTEPRLMGFSQYGQPIYLNPAEEQHNAAVWERRVNAFGIVGSFALYGSGIGEIDEGFLGYSVGEARELDGIERSLSMYAGTIQAFSLYAGARGSVVDIFGNAAETTVSAATPVGRLGSPLGTVARNTPATIEGRVYTGHALDQMQARGLTPTVVENTVQSGTRAAGNTAREIVHYDAVNNVTVVTDAASGRVVTVFGGKK